MLRVKMFLSPDCGYNLTFEVSVRHEQFSVDRALSAFDAAAVAAVVNPSGSCLNWASFMWSVLGTRLRLGVVVAA